MRTSLRRTILAALGIAPFAVPAAAQTNSELAGYLGTLVTPAGALPGWVAPTMADVNGDAFGLRAEYGRVQLESSPPINANTFGGSIDLLIAKGRIALSATGGYLFPECPTGAGGVLVGANCSGFAIAGAELLARLIRYHVDVARDTGELTVSLSARGGRAFPDNSTVYSYGAGVPFAIATYVGRSTRFVPFITPGVTWGHVETDVPSGSGAPRLDATGTRFVLSGGVAFIGAHSGLGLHATVNRIFVEGARTQFGFALSWNSIAIGRR
jgi:hypothetical protein